MALALLMLRAVATTGATGPGGPDAAGGQPGDTAGAGGGRPVSGEAGRPAGRMLFHVMDMLLAPAMLALSAYLFLRGHYAPGGGFIAALVAGGAVAFGWFARGRAGGPVPVLRALRARPLVAAGLLTSVAVGLAPALVGEPFLTPLHATVAGVPLTTSLLFDLGVYLIVLGLLVAAVSRLGTAEIGRAHV